jgi:predicted nucleic acid-binding protein
MILVDTSIWIELLAGRTKLASVDDLTHFVTCGPVVQEVTQGLRSGRESDAFRTAFLAVERLSDPLPLNVFLEAAELYRYGRSRGYTIRSSTDCLIAAIAIENRVPVWHCDRDFSNIARYTRLSIFDSGGIGRLLP